MSSNSQLCIKMSPQKRSNDSDDDDDVGVFTFQKRSFTKRTVTTYIETPVTTSKCRKRRQQGGSASGNRCDESLAAINRKSRETHKRVAKLVAKDVGSSDDEDSDDQGGGSTKKALGTASTPAAIDILDLLDDDDDDDCQVFPASQSSVQIIAQSGTASMETCQALLKARTAKLELEKAQKYHAEDVYVPTISTSPLQLGSQHSSLISNGRALTKDAPVGHNGKQVPMQPSRPPVNNGTSNMGPTLKLTLRSVCVTDGKRSSPTSEQQTIRRNEPFEALVRRYLDSKHLDISSTHVVMKFDGQTIAMDKTPAVYDIEDEDMIDCEVRVTATQTPAAAAPSVASLPIKPTTSKGGGLSCRLKLVTKGQRHQQPTVETFTVKQHNPVQVLLNQYVASHNLAANATVAFKFDGEVMNTNRSIESYDLDDDDQIDVIVKL